MKHISGLFDKLFEQQTRQLAQRSSRRGMLKSLGGMLVGAGAIPLLPVARAAAAEAPGHPVEEGDPASCDYWRYCAIDGFLCSCCGGSRSEERRVGKEGRARGWPDRERTRGLE